MEKVSLTLTRLLSEIKTTEERLMKLPVIIGVVANSTGRVAEENETSEEFKKTSQSRFDSWFALSERLVKLRAARNKANATTMVTVCGKTVTMDEAITMKSLLNLQKQAVEGFKKQIGMVETFTTRADNEVKAAVDKAVAQSIASQTLTEEQTKMFQDMYQKSLGKTAVIGESVKAGLKKLEDHITSFSAEIDYVLSEANSTTRVEV